VGEGRPAKIAITPGSYTGQFLKRYYKSDGERLAEAELTEDAIAVAGGNVNVDAGRNNGFANGPTNGAKNPGTRMKGKSQNQAEAAVARRQKSRSS
jgi:hypothetical protein